MNVCLTKEYYIPLFLFNGIENLFIQGMCFLIITMFNLLRISFRDFFHNNVHIFAAGISYWTILSLIPLLLGLLAIMGQIFSEYSKQLEVTEVLLDILPLQSVVIRSTINNIIDSKEEIGFMATIGLIITGRGFLSAIRLGINQTWDPGRHPDLLTRFFQHVGILIGIIIFFVVMAVDIDAVKKITIEVATQNLYIGSQGFWEFLLSVYSREFVIFVSLIFLYKYIPNQHVSWSNLWPGVATGWILIDVVRFCFGSTINLSENYSAIFGSFGVLMSIMAWIYFSACSILFGSQVVSTYSRTEQDENEFTMYFKRTWYNILNHFGK